MKLNALIFTTIVSLSFVARAEEKMKMNYPNEEITKIVEQYSKATGQKFIIDSTVRGKISILNSTEVSTTEAFNQLSIALALNGYTIVNKNNVFVIRNARSAQRDGIEVVSELPKADPERMITWVMSIKNISANDIQQEIRLLTSSYGEIAVNRNTNQLILTDFSSNMQRVAEVIKRLDVKPDPSIAKIVADSKKEHMEKMAKKDRMDGMVKRDMSRKDPPGQHLIPQKEDTESN